MDHDNNDTKVNGHSDKYDHVDSESSGFLSVIQREEDAELDGHRVELLNLKKQRLQVEEEVKALEMKRAEILLQEQALEDRINTVLTKRSENESSEPISAEKRKEYCLLALEEQLEKVKNNQKLPDRCKGLKFLEDGDARRDMAYRIALASYPRSGNSLLRSLIEQLTGVYTGSDGDPNRPLNRQLVDVGMMGEGMVEDTVFAVKTHFPERLGRCKVQAGRAIVLVRNPFDCLCSYFNMILTETHTHTIEDEEYVKYANIWDVFVREETEIWKQFYAHWVNSSVKRKIPLLFVRYEDLLQNRRVTLEKIAKFVLKMDDLTGTKYVSVIDEICASQISTLGSYQPRQKVVEPMDVDCAPTENEWLPVSQSALKNLRFFNQKQQDYVLSAAKSELVSFGYWTSFFEPAHGTAKRTKNACLVLKKSRSGTSATADSNEEDDWTVVLNQRYGVRPITKDDPYARGFGKRWKAKLAVLPMVRVKEKGTH